MPRTWNENRERLNAAGEEFRRIQEQISALTKRVETLERKVKAP